LIFNRGYVSTTRWRLQFFTRKPRAIAAIKWGTVAEATGLKPGLAQFTRVAGVR